MSSPSMSLPETVAYALSALEPSSPQDSALIEGWIRPMHLFVTRICRQSLVSADNHPALHQPMCASSSPPAAVHPCSEPSPMFPPAASSTHISHRQDECRHARTSYLTPHGEMETMDTTYTKQEEWTVFRMVGSVLPGPLRLRRTAATAAAAAKEPRQRTAVQRKAVGMTTQSDAARSRSAIGSKLENQGLPDRREFDLALTQGKGLASMVASTAAALGQPSEGSGVDWKSASQGLDLIFNASREYAAHHDADYHADFERSTYVNGVQHVLRGLPRDLEPGEAVMLHRAMPSVLAAESQPAAGPGFEGKQGATTPGGGGGQNVVQIFVLLCLCWLSSFARWIVPRAVAYGRRMVEAERKHEYFPRLLLAATALLHAIVQLLRCVGEFWPCRVVFLVLEYAAQGVRGAVYEFGERAVAREAARRRVTRVG